VEPQRRQAAKVTAKWRRGASERIARLPPLAVSARTPYLHDEVRHLGPLAVRLSPGSCVCARAFGRAI